MKLPKIPLSRKNKASKDSSSFIALDLNEYSVKCSYFEEIENSKVALKGFSKRTVYDGKISSQHISAAISETLALASAKTDRLIVGLGGDEVFGFILIVKIKRPNPEKPVTEKEMGGLYEKIRQAANDQAKLRWATFFADEAEFEPLDLVVTSTKLDEEINNNPVGMPGESLQVGVFCSYAKKSYFNLVTRLLSDCSILTVTTTLYSQVKLLAEETKNFILVDIGGNHTDVAVVFGQSIMQTKSFEFGGEYFTKHLSKNLQLDVSNARGRKETYSAGTLADEEMDKVGDSLYEAGKDWRLALGTVLSSMSGIKSFPKDIILTGGGANLTILQELLYEEDWRQSIPFSGDVEVKLTSPQNFEKYVVDELNLMKGPEMFVPASLGVVRLELNEP